MLLISKPEKKAGNDNYATSEEAMHAISELGDSDHVKLTVIARYFTKTRLKWLRVGADDLLQEAILKTLDGRRRWRRGVSIIKHLERVMESDSGHIVENSIGSGTVRINEDEGTPSDPSFDTSSVLDAGIDLDRIIGLFKDDKVTAEVLMLRADGLSASDIMYECKLDRTHYQTVLKRIRRRLLRHLSKKGDLDESE